MDMIKVRNNEFFGIRIHDFHGKNHPSHHRFNHCFSIQRYIA
jgi:hypothetical protein